MENTKNLIKIPIINIWYVIITLIFILMRITNIIDWSPLWLLSPLWIPAAIIFAIIIVLYLLKGLVYLIDYICYKRKK